MHGKKIPRKLQICAQDNAILTALLLVSNAFLCNMRYTGILKSRERCIENEWNFGILKKSMSDENDSFVGKCRHVINLYRKKKSPLKICQKCGVHSNDRYTRIFKSAEFRKFECAALDIVFWDGPYEIISNE